MPLSARARVFCVLCWVAVAAQTSPAAQAQQEPGRAAAPVASRLAPGLEKRPAGQALRVSVTDVAAFRQWLARELPKARATAQPRHPDLLQVRGAAAVALAACPWVRFVDVADRPARPERQINSSNLAVNKISLVHRCYPRLAGQGLTVSIKESPLDQQDIDFKGRLVNPDPQAQMLTAHATIMATLIAGGGNSSPSGKGAAWQARIAQSSYDNLLPDDGAGLTSQGVSVQNHSYGVGIESYYGLEARAYDQQARQFPNLLHVFSAGNSGTQPGGAGRYTALPATANITGQFKMSKNTLSVGATTALGQVVPLSSRGPAHDGRIKPELVAFGDGGTSDAAALVSGMSLLVQQAYREQHGALPAASLVKAALLNSADDTGRPHLDHVAGFGQADAQGAVRTMLDNRFREGSLAQGQEQALTLTVPPGTHRLKATLVWTDPEAAANASQALINDLDLTLEQAGQRWHPWTLSTFPHADSLALPARRRPDRLNNAEQITLDLPAAGTYQLRVRGHAVPQGPQRFSVVYELETGLTWANPTAARALRAGSPAVLRWDWAGPATPARLEYSYVGQPQRWRPLSTSLNLSEQAFVWTAPPDTTALLQLRLLTATASYTSDTVVLARPLALDVAYNCPDETLLAWARVPGIAQYQVYQLGATHLQLYRLVPDTALLLTPAEAAGRHFAVAPVLPGSRLVGERGSTIDASRAEHGCYVRSFIARQLVTDSVEFDLVLGSTFQLQSLTLERLQPDGTYLPVQTLAPGRRTTFLLRDLAPRPGRAEYRVRLLLTGGRTRFSNLEEVFVVGGLADVLVYPVPVVSGQPLRIIGPPDQALRIRVVDMIGRQRLEVNTEPSAVAQFDTHTLGAGLYLLRISVAGSTTEVVRRVFVQ